MSVSPGALAQVECYFNAWNTGDAEGVAAVFAPGGSYTDPTVTGPPLSGAALAEHVGVLVAGFPDLSFEMLGAQAVDGGPSGGTVVVRWLMRGSHTGPLGAWPATGCSVAVRGAEFITVTGGKLGSVERYFDRQTLAEQLGLQVIVQPDADGPWQHGYAYRATAGSTQAPGAVSLTWIDVRSDEEAAQVEALGDQVAAELLKTPGFISLLGGGIGHRLYLITAWESLDVAREAMRNSPHTAAVKRFFTEDFGAAVGTGIWSVHHLNPLWVRCHACAQVTDRARANGACPCGQPLPEPPQRW